MSTPASDLYQQNAGVHALNTGPIVIRTYNDLSGNNTFLLGKYDIPISSNYVLITSANGKLVPSNAIYVSSIAASTITSLSGNISTLNANNINVSSLAAISSNINMLNANRIDVSTLNGSTMMSQFINYSSIIGSSILTNTLVITSTFYASNLASQSLNFSTGVGSILTVNSLIVNSTLSIPTLNLTRIDINILKASTFTVNTQVVNSTLLVSTLNVSTIISRDINYSTLTGSSITSRLVTFSTSIGSSLISGNINYSTLTGSTITTNTQVVNSILYTSTLIANNISVSNLALEKFSTLYGSTLISGNINYSTLTGSTLTTNTQIVNSTIFASTLIATNISALTSSMVSIGASTNRSYVRMSQGLFSTSNNWSLSLNNLVNIKTVTMSVTGQTQLAITTANTATSIYYTSTLGLSWAAISNARGLPGPTTTSYSSGIASGNGQYGILGDTLGNVYITSTLTSSSRLSFNNTIPIPLYIYLPFNNSIEDVQGKSTVTSNPSNLDYVVGLDGLNAVNLINTVGQSAIQYIQGTWPTPSNFTIKFLFNPQNIVGVIQLICTFGNGTSGISIHSDNKIRFFTENGIDIRTIFTAAANTWYYVIVIYQSSGICSLYINNTLIGQATSSGSITGSGFGLATWDDSITDTPFNGFIDDFRIYNYALNSINNVAINNIGKYMLISVNNGGLYISRNYGESFSQITTVSLQSEWNALAMSGTGQYMVAYPTPVSTTPQLGGIASMSWIVNNILWNASSSSVYDVLYPYYAFNTDTTNFWSSSRIYSFGIPLHLSTTIVNTDSAIPSILFGEWIQIDSIVTSQLYSYAFTAYADSGGYFLNHPKDYTIAGSNDGSNWFLIQSGSIQGNYDADSSIRSYFIIANQTAEQVPYSTRNVRVNCISSQYSANMYRYFRLIVTRIKDNSNFDLSVSLAQWLLNFDGSGYAFSSTFGTSWTPILSFTMPILAISGNGQYTIGTNQIPTAYIINNFIPGRYSIPVFFPTLSVINIPVAVAISQTGQYIVLVTNGILANVYYSTNYGSNFTGLKLGSTTMTSCSISSDGFYVTVTNATTVYQLNNNSSGYSVAVGNIAGLQNQGQNAIAIGNQSGQQNQGQNTIAIGNYAGQINQLSNSIILNASGSAIYSYISGFYVAPIAEFGYSSDIVNLLAYGSDNQIVKSSITISPSSYNPYGILNIFGEVVFNSSITTFGNVGFGTKDPQYTIDVRGTSHSSAHLYADDSAMVSARPALDYNTFGQNWNRLSAGLPSGYITWDSVAISASGQYQTISGTSTPSTFYSNNYGRSWIASTGISPYRFYSISMSASGQYQVAGTAYDLAGVFYSNNYGASWIQVTPAIINVRGTCISASGQYACISTTATVYCSSNYGVSWATPFSLSYISGIYQTIAMSASGQYQITVLSNQSYVLNKGGIYYSSDYGVTWTQSNITTINPQHGAMSASGKYACILMWNTSDICISNNYGVTWTYITTDIPFGGYPENLFNIAISASGQYQVIGKDYGLYYSTNYGITWDEGFYAENMVFKSVAISANGQYSIACGSIQYVTSYIYTSVIPFPEMTINGNIYPRIDNAYDLGSDILRFKTIYATDGVVTTSDSNEKDLILLPYGLNEVKQIRTIMYKWKSQSLLPDTDPKKNFKYYGICADQLMNIFPELVYNEDPNIPMQLNYSELIPVVIKAIQEQNNIILELQNTQNIQTQTINSLEFQLASIKK